MFHLTHFEIHFLNHKSTCFLNLILNDKNFMFCLIISHILKLYPFKNFLQVLHLHFLPVWVSQLTKYKFKRQWPTLEDMADYWGITVQYRIEVHQTK